MSDSSSSGSSPDAGAEPGATLRAPDRPAGAVIVAAGAGRRMGPAEVPKQYLYLHGAPVLLWSVGAFIAHPEIGPVVVVLPQADAADPPSWLSELPVRIAPGGATRMDSVRSGLAALRSDVDLVLVHDGARPLVSEAVITRVLRGIGDGAAIAALPVTDTVKVATPDGAVARTLEREGLWLAQTPQGFRIGSLREVHRRAAADGVQATDDASLCERYGIRVTLVEGAVENMKITRPGDLRVVEALSAVNPNREP